MNKDKSANAAYNETIALASRLKNYFLGKEGAIIAFSGGVDSSLLAYTARLSLGDRMVAVIADSPSLAEREHRLAIAFAGKHKIPLETVKTEEMNDSRYIANMGNRCYYCKESLFKELLDLQNRLAANSRVAPWPIFYGANTDDLRDFRPGMKAAKKASVKAPFIDLGMNKESIRKLCSYYNLEVAHKPAAPCLASRIPYFEEVTLKKLKQVEEAESFLIDMGFQEVRVRNHGDTARIEVLPNNFPDLTEHHEKITKKFHSLGFQFVSMDLDGFKSGSLNTALEFKKTNS
ncbi:MAG: ATP-dependent sacrificial sulfur transferase LarE, partial [Deltaproteobacteria bacterium]|nr:ATP-dependent sacrificial sulfur transferase LarE [Deltaproteobacteria bacterium]